ncbi:GOLPH3/VPS74 family protein [Brevibacterium yomogidense]|uniref:GOLPH3/VPS74 family protein n=1 Tax=Brevibacterium yomogidense TaxID=946573 RepID=UPI0018DF3541|nr:GPP34 family phosphoprotein [Brevibacterium yomogidense]
MTDEHPPDPDGPLLLVEDLALLLADDSTGTPAGASTLHCSLGAAVLVELALLGRVETRQKSWLSGVVVHATGDGPLPDPLLQEAYDAIAAEPQPVTSLLMTIGADLWTTLLHRLADRGLVSQEKGRFLGIIPTTTYPATDDPYEPALRKRVADILELGHEADARTAALIGLVSASGTLPSLHPQPRWSGTIHSRGKEFEKGEWGAEALGTAVLQTAAAVAAAGAAAVIAGTTSPRP